MARVLKLRRGTTAEHSTFTGAEGEVTVDTTTDSLVVHDNVTVGGHRQASEAYVDAAIANVGGGNANTGNVSFSNVTISTSLTDANLVIDPDGTGVVNIESNLHVHGNSIFLGSSDNLVMRYRGAGEGGNPWARAQFSTAFGGNANVAVQIFSNDSSFMFFNPLNGNIGINSLNPTDTLSVNGTVRSNHVSVDSGFDGGFRFESTGLGGDVIGLTGLFHINSNVQHTLSLVHNGQEYLSADVNGWVTSGNIRVFNDFNVGGEADLPGNTYVGLRTSFIAAQANLQYAGDQDDYLQFIMQNKNTGINASTDMVMTADNGDDTQGFIDIGINGSNYSDPAFSISGAGDGYLYVHGIPNVSGNLAIGTVHERDIVFHTGGTTSADEIARFQHGEGLVMHGNIIPAANVTYNLGEPGNEWNSLYVSGNTIYVGGIPLSVDNAGNLIVNGNIVSGTPTVPNTVKGFINLVGDRPNNDSTIGFSTVAVWGDYAYVLGSDFYFTSSTDKTKVYKFDLRTGEQVWVKQIRSSRGAEFNLTIGSGTVTLDLIADSGTGYKVGEEIVIRGGDIGGSNPVNDVTIIVDTIDGSGGVNTASIKPGYDVTGLTGTYTNIAIQNDDIVGDTCAIAYSPIINKVLAVSEYWTNYGNNEDTNWNWTNLYVIDPVTGVIDSTVTLSDEGDIYPYSIDVTSVNGDAAIAGEKFNEYREFGTLTLLAGYNGYFDILKEDLDPEHYPGEPYSSIYDYWITGTGITGQNNIDNINSYPGSPTTVREGSGAQFQVVSAGDGVAYVSALATVPNKGINYLVGHKIKILGTDLGGVTPGNDAIITVTEIGTGGSIEAVTISGTAGDTVGVGGTYNGLTGTNYNVGSGSIVTLSLNNQTGSFDVINIDNTGLNYVVGDVLTVAGTQFANGATPTHDATLVVNSVDGTGAITGFVGVTGTGQTNALRIFVDGVDFTAPGGSWSMRQNLGGEAFVWTANWSNAIGGPSGDRFYDVSWNSDATAIYAVGVGRYEVNYDQALVVKFNAVTGAVIWSKDIKFSEATTEYRQARAVCMIPNSSDIMVAGAWYNNASGYDEIILTRMTSEGAAVWQKTYLLGENESGFYFDYEISIKALDSTNVLVSFEQGTNDSQGLAYLKVNATTGLVVLHRVLSSPGNGNYNAHDTATPTFADIYTEGGDDYVVMAGRTYVPTDDSRNALLIKLPVDGLKNLEISERLSLGEHLLTRHDVVVTTVTPAFDSFTPDEHLNTITNLENARNYSTIAPDGELGVWTYTVTDDTAGFLEFGDGSKQSFATNVIPQIPAANDYYLTEQDSGKHLFFEHENGWVYIPHWQLKTLPVGFTFTVVNTTGSDCFVQTETGPTNRGRLKLAGRNIDTYVIGIPDSGSGSMVTFLKVKQGYYMPNSDGDQDYPEVWMVSGPGDIYNND